MGQNFSSQKTKQTQKPSWRPEVLLTEVIETADYDPITIRKRKASADIPRQSGPNKKDVNKAVKFVQEFLPLYTNHANHDEANISMGTSPLMAMDINTFSQDRALTDAKVQEEIKRVCDEGHKNSTLAKELFNEQAGHMFKKFSFANQREELLQQQNKFFKVGSFGPAQSTPDISKYVEGNEKKNAPDAPVNAFDSPTRTPKMGGNENVMTPERPSFHSHNSPDKKFGGHFGGDHGDISAISVDLTKKQSISFRIESKDQSKASEEDIGFKSAVQTRAQLAPIEEKVTSDIADAVKTKPEIHDNILIQNNIYDDKPQQVAPQECKQSTRRNLPAEEKTKPTKHSHQQSRKDPTKASVSQSKSSKQWPSSSPKIDRKDKRSKENIQTDKYQLVTSSKVASDKPSLKSSVQYENLGTQKRANGENYSSLNNIQRQRTEPLRQSNIIQDNSQGYKVNKVEKGHMARQDMNQGWPSNRNDVNHHERNNYQQAPVKKHLEATPNTHRTNKWLSDENKMSVQTSSPQFATDVNPINVDLNLDELLRAADNGSISYGYPPNTIQQSMQMQQMQSMQPMQQSMQPMQPMQPMYMNYTDMRFSPNYAMAMPFQMGFQQQPTNMAGQYLSAKHLDETAYHEENSQFGGGRNNNSMYQSRHDISQDLSDYSIDAGRGNQLNNSYMRRNKHRNVPQLYILNQHRGTQQTEFH